MKKTVFIFLVFLSVVSKIEAQGAKQDLSKVIIGEWTIFMSKSVITGKNGINEEIERHCNVCPKVTFKNDQTAEVKSPGGSIENYEWKIANDKINFKIVNESKYKTFEKEYLLKFHVGLNKLELITEVDKSSLILSRICDTCPQSN